MKGVAVVAIVVIAFLAGFAFANPPLVEPMQYEQLCNALKVAGNGTVDLSTSLIDKRIALEYKNAMSGDGSMEMDLEGVYSQAAGKIIRDIELGNETKPAKINLFESSKVVYSGLMPLVGEKFIRSKAFYGGIGAVLKERYSVNQMEEDQKVHVGTTSSATGAHLIGFDTKGAFSGTWETDSTWHKIFYKDIKSHQSFTGKFEIDRKVALHEEESPITSELEVTKTPSQVMVGLGSAIVYDFLVRNTGMTPISGLTLLDSILGQINLSKTALNPGESASGSATYVIEEEDLLEGAKETKAMVSGMDSLGKPVNASGTALQIPKATYYPGGSLSSGGRGRMNYSIYQPLNLTEGNATIYALDVNMTQSRQPAPPCPFSGWPAPNALAMLLFGITDGRASVWQNLSLATGNYSGSQIYGSAEGNVTRTSSLNWNSTYAGNNPNGGFSCTGDITYDTFDLKLLLTNLGPKNGLGVASYQRIHNSTDIEEPAKVWRKVGYQEIPDGGMNKMSIQPFIIVANMDIGESATISWSKVMALQ